jgi:hypothetical protein
MESDGYALEVADTSFGWYRSAAIRARRLYRVTEIGVLLVSAAIPVVAAIQPDTAVVPAVLGAVVVVLSGLRGLFHWQDNYLRFSTAREAVEAERRAYRTASGPYADPATRDAELTAAVTRIEQSEMANWTKLAAQRPRT